MTLWLRELAIQNHAMTSEIRNPNSAIRYRHWLLVTLEVSRGLEEIAGMLLFELGSTGIITLDETEDKVRLGAYFDQEANEHNIRRDIEEGLGPTGTDSGLLGLSLETVVDQDWLQRWKEGFDASSIGERIIVAPSWKVPLVEVEDRVVIKIDPGMAFGTGTHETTRLCLEAIERHLQGGSLLDVGTGTGILAIAAALLAPGSRVVAIDIDPQAVEVAHENLVTNGVSSTVELFEAQPSELTGETFDIVVANLTAEVIVDLMGDLASRVAAEGLMILSGILSEFAGDVERSLAAAGFTVIERYEAGEWCLLTSRRV